MTIKTRPIDTHILDILSMATVDGNVVTLNNGQLERANYVAVNKVLEAMGGKWNRYKRGHVFDDDPTDALEAVVMTGSYQHPEDLGWFATPEPLADRLVDLLVEAGADQWSSFLEPSAGEGALVDKLVERGAKQPFITCCEIDHRRASALIEKGYHALTADFLSWRAELPSYEHIIMNPPFAKQQDIDHVMHAWSLLAPGGRLVAITSLGVSFRQNRKTVAFRELVEDYGFTENNPEDAFKESGTNVRTMTIVLDKPEAA